jgi:hypothetical protein
MTLLEGLERASLLQMVETRVRLWTHNRVRNLAIREREGRFVICGQVASQHMKQLAHQGALEVLSNEQFASDITVYVAVSRRGDID